MDLVHGPEQGIQAVHGRGAVPLMWDGSSVIRLGDLVFRWRLLAVVVPAPLEPVEHRDQARGRRLSDPFHGRRVGAVVAWSQHTMCSSSVVRRRLDDRRRAWLGPRSAGGESW